MFGRKCRVCGCTDLNACMTAEGPCSWISDCVCSACAVPGVCCICGQPTVDPEAQMCGPCVGGPEAFDDEDEPLSDDEPFFPDTEVRLYTEGELNLAIAELRRREASL